MKVLREQKSTFRTKYEVLFGRWMEVFFNLSYRFVESNFKEVTYYK